jgi:aminopeptidase N
LDKYSFQSVKTQNFFDEVNKVSDFDTAKFSKVWLESTVFDTKTVNELLSKNKTTSYYFELDKYENHFFQKAGFMAEILQSDAYYAQKKQLLIS